MTVGRKRLYKSKLVIRIEGRRKAALVVLHRSR